MSRSQTLVLLVAVLAVGVAVGGWLYFAKARPYTELQQKASGGVDSPAGEIVITHSTDQEETPYKTSVLNGLLVKKVIVTEVKAGGETIPKVELIVTYLRDGVERQMILTGYGDLGFQDESGVMKFTDKSDWNLEPGSDINADVIYVPKNRGSLRSLGQACRQYKILPCLSAIEAGFKGESVDLEEYIGLQEQSQNKITLDPNKVVLYGISKVN